MVPRRQPHSDDNQSIDSGDDIGFPTVNDVDINDVDINDVDTGYERGISTGSAISFSRRGEIIEATSEDHSAMRNLAISAGYIKRAGSDSADASAIERPGAGRSSLSSLNRAHLCARKLIRSRYFAHIMVVVVLFDAFLTASDIDARAAGEDTSVVVIAASSACLALYTLELILQVVVRGRRIFHDWLTKLDVLIIGSGYAEIFLGLMLDVELLDKIGIVRVLRLSRIIRLMQLLRKNRSLKELRKLVTMLATCMKTLLWSFLFCFLVMTGWAMLIVEIINPYIIEMKFAGAAPFDQCPECVRATSSVMHANLMLFKTVIAGDSWGQIAVPMIEAHPETAIIFVGASLTLVFGVLNLIVAVVVDTFAETRENDVVNLAQEMEFSMEDDQQILKQIFRRIDTNEDGELTLEELLHGARTDSEFQSRLRVMDIDEVDLQQFFDMIDLDGSGSIEADEFVIPLSRWVHDSKTAPRFIKYNLMRAMAQQEELLKYSHQHFAAISEHLQDITNALEGRPLRNRRPSTENKPRGASASKEPPVAKRVSWEENVGDAAHKETKARDALHMHAERVERSYVAAIRTQLDKLKTDVELSLQASVKALEDCIHEASVGLQNMPLTSLASVSPITGQDSSPGGSSARMEQAVVTSAAPCSQARAPGPENATREGTPSKNAALHIDDLISGSVQGPGLRTMEV